MDFRTGFTDVCGEYGYFGNKKTAAVTEMISNYSSLLRAPPGTRTLDTLIKSQVLYQLS